MANRGENRNFYGNVKFDNNPVRIFEVDNKGNCEEKSITVDELWKDRKKSEKSLEKSRSEEKIEKLKVENRNILPKRCEDRKLKGETKRAEKTRATMPLRDLMIFTRFEFDKMEMTPEELENFEEPTNPTIKARPLAGCFLLELEHIKLLCKSDSCLIINPVQNEQTNISRGHIEEYVKSFVNDLKLNLTSEDGPKKEFEMVVLETALSSVTARLRTKLSDTMKPQLRKLIDEFISASLPTETMLREILKFKHKITKFENDVIAIKAVINECLSNDQDMADLRLTRIEQFGEVDVTDHEAIEFLFEAFACDLRYIDFEVKRMHADIVDAEAYMDIYMKTTTNKILGLNVKLETGSLVMGFGALITGIGGMNFQHGLGDKVYVFWIVTGVLLLLSFLMYVYNRHHYKVMRKNVSKLQRKHFNKLDKRGHEEKTCKVDNDIDERKRKDQKDITETKDSKNTRFGVNLDWLKNKVTFSKKTTNGQFKV